MATAEQQTAPVGGGDAQRPVQQQQKEQPAGAATATAERPAAAPPTALAAVDSAPGIGLAAWEAQRRQWRRKRPRDSSGEGSSEGSEPPPRRRAIPAGASYDDLLSTGRRFEQPVPLNEMVSFLVSCWEDNIGL